jgi:hypothetical protein
MKQLDGRCFLGCLSRCPARSRHALAQISTHPEGWSGLTAVLITCWRSVDGGTLSSIESDRSAIINHKLTSRNSSSSSQKGTATCFLLPTCVVRSCTKVPGGAALCNPCALNLEGRHISKTAPCHADELLCETSFYQRADELLCETSVKPQLCRVAVRRRRTGDVLFFTAVGLRATHHRCRQFRSLPQLYPHQYVTL